MLHNVHMTSMLTSGVFVGLAEVLRRANAGAIASTEVTLALEGAIADSITASEIQAVDRLRVEQETGVWHCMQDHALWQLSDDNKAGNGVKTNINNL